MPRTLFAIIPLLLLAFAANMAPAQNAVSRDPAALLDRIRIVTEQLSLTADQKTQVDGLFKRADHDLQSAMQDLQNASQDEKSARARAFFGDLRRQLGDVLSKDQKTELQQKLQELRSPTTAPSTPGNPPEPTQSTPSTTRGPGGLGQNGGRPGGPGRGAQFLQRLRSGLDQAALSDDQRSQVDQLLLDLQQQFQTVRASVQSGAIDRPSAREKVQSIMETARSRLGNILTLEQQQKLRDSMQPNPGGPPARPPVEGRTGAGFGNTGINRPPTLLPQATTAPVQPPGSSAEPPAIGQSAPDFALKLLNGEKVGPSSYSHKLLVLVLGSYTNPSFRDHAAGLEALRGRYSGRGVNFLIIYTRETHPTGGWEVQRNKTDGIDIPQPTTQSERNAVAGRAKSALNLSIAFAPDTMDDKTAAAYAIGDGTPAYLIGRDGKILFRQSWLEPMALEQAIGDAIQ